MIFKINKIDYEKLFISIFNDFEYNLNEKNISQGYIYSYWIFQKKNFPNIKATLERGRITLEVQIENNFWSLTLIYKFLHHNKIVRGSYSSDKELKLLFPKDSKLYLKEYLEKKDTIFNKDLERFYEEFPSYGFVWT